MIQEFHISVTPLGSDRYLVRTERIAPGVPIAEEQITWSVEEWLAHAHYLMNDPLLGFFQDYRANRIGGFELPAENGDRDTASDLPISPMTLVELGQRLYGALFQGRLRDSWMTAQGIAQHKGEILRLRLGLKGSRLMRLPWEVLYANDASLEGTTREGLAPAPRPITAGKDVVFSRYQPGTPLIGGRSLNLELDQPLRILMAIATPPDQERLELMQEAKHLQQELQSANGYSAEGQLTPLPNIQLTILDQPGREQLTQALEQGQYHILHYAGHSNLGAAGGDLYLVNPRTGLTEMLNGDDLAGLLVNNGIRMAVFNSCRGAHTPVVSAQEEGDRNLAEALVGRGIPVVLAMAERIPDDVAITFTRLFYRNLKQGYPIDLSLSRARQGLITSYGSHQLYWALPILYLHPEFDGYLFRGDRSDAEPGDRLPLLPTPSYTSPLPAREEATPSRSSRSTASLLDSEDDLQIIARAVLAEESLLPSPVVPTDEPALQSPITEGGPPYPETDSDDDLLADDNVSGDPNLLNELITHTTTPAVQRPSSARQHTSLVNALERDNEDALFPPTTSAVAPALLELPDIPAPPLLPDNYPDAPLPVVDKGRRTVVAPFSSGIKWHYLLLPLAGAVGALSLAFASFHLLPRLFSSPTPPVASPASPATTPELASTAPLTPPDPFSTTDTPTVTTIAIGHFNQKELAAGGQGVESLLNRGALKEAEAALKAIAPGEVDQPDIAFLKGRLAWESIKRGNPDYDVIDVVRFWESAVQGNPASLRYQIALAFALYAKGDSEAAFDQWCQVLSSLPSDSKTGVLGQSACPLPQVPITDNTTLTAIAGMALTLKQNAEVAGQGPRLESPEVLTTESIKLYNLVLHNDPLHFQPDELGTVWLWSEPAIEQWRSLASSAGQ